ncbi:hypothetical protein TRIUR3_30153 [Triticum urartu]|uniref:Uncharacterized protein n=1 Tax=Triticum urartu TaxID=4572 RepID=M7ZZ25_TRIUA|nr:hypothetical protein TRIUR3_30153 [Triticum urartu]
MVEVLVILAMVVVPVCSERYLMTPSPSQSTIVELEACSAHVFIDGSDTLVGEGLGENPSLRFCSRSQGPTQGLGETGVHLDGLVSVFNPKRSNAKDSVQWYLVNRNMQHQTVLAVNDGRRAAKQQQRAGTVQPRRAPWP